MDKLTRYLIDNSEKLIGNPVRPTERVLARSDAPLYLWRKMGMSHQLMAEKSPEEWAKLAPAAHLYPLGVEELNKIKPYLNKFYIELKSAIGSVGNDLWYLARTVTYGEESNVWWLFRGSENIGSVDITTSQEVEYATNADEALVNLVIHLMKDFPKTCELSSCVLLPFGCSNKAVWEYAMQVILMGEEESQEFIDNVVGNYEAGKPTIRVVPKW